MENEYERRGPAKPERQRKYGLNISLTKTDTGYALDKSFTAIACQSSNSWKRQ